MIGDLAVRVLLKLLGLKAPTQQQLDALDPHIAAVAADEKGTP